MTEHIKPIASELLSNDLVITAQINILNDKQQPIRCRALLDTGSSMNFITEELAKSLRIRQNKCSVPIGALDTLTTTSKRHITATITSTDDKEGILRVGGRLSHSSMTFAQKHPIVLPKSSVTARIIDHKHKIHMHSGTQATLYAVRQRYWPVDGRSQVWRAIKGCVRCCRAQPPPVEYVMGNLPEARVTESRPFTNVGVDYCGPFHTKEKRDRNRRQIKVYVAIFVCLAIKAVHIELVDDLTSEAFIAALRRFIARRGYCSTIHSDNGTNFRGASNELRELHDLLQSDDHKEKVTAFLADKQIEWRFIPPHSPHFGGLWEAA
ncbi:uncharacterized protein LOC117241539, partial [Bombus vosnesenskii]|uniref:Uncharacterized protein LOC117241539 n=1 Tax=Bombus vosnesenskii TaxID=207650 RepID=A0A6J3LCI9_9HYME